MGMNQHIKLLVFLYIFQPGYASWIGKYADRDAVLVEFLYDLGAVPFVRTNVPQTLMVLAFIFCERRAPTRMG